ncbi:minor capsid protein [Caminicella sporogenes]|uniref:minor capsid protein n=1 Tax=Caminicella sporogenes TaxID=166485 RepID=UPI00253FB675|nr:minor capsid protein [Caminicella sporogenes]WIF95032.1 minor capsid protein [Caminicella sporogenes]
MKNSKYWENRANQRKAIYHKNSDRTIETITKAYDKAVKDIEEEIRKIYDKFSTAGKLSPREARKLLNSKIPVKELNRIRNKIKHIQDEDIKRRLLSILNVPAYKARITRLEALKQDIYIQSKMIADVELRASTSQYIDTINEAYYKQIYDIQKGLGIGFDIAVMPAKTIEVILKNLWSGKHFSERIWHNTDVLAEKLTEIITSGFMSGKSIDKMARELQEYTEYGKYAAIRLVRTETTYMANAAEMESYKECGIEKYIYVATLDNRTSTICQSLDRKVFNVKDGVPGKNMPPMHPFCRSTTRAYLGPDTLKGIKRRARDPKIGKTYLVPGNMSYKEWYQKYVVDKYGKDQAEIMKKKVINKASDKKQYKRYKEVLGKDMPVKTFDKFQDLKYNDIEEWKKVKALYRDVNWQLQAQKNIVEGSVHTVPFSAEPNSVFDNYKDGKIVSRRYYGSTGKPRLDIDLTDHNNPKIHKIVPHAHSWNFKDEPYMEAPEGLQGREKPGRKLTRAEEIANKEIIKKVK